jgi:hypothetical protein
MNYRRFGGILLALGVILAGSLTAAPVVAQESDDPLVEDLDALVATYNDNLDQVPALFRGQLANERVDIRVERDDGTDRFYAETGQNARVESLERGTGERQPTVRVRTDERTLSAIGTADDPAARAVEAYNDGDISITGVGVVNSVRVAVVKTAVDVGRLIGLL